MPTTGVVPCATAKPTRAPAAVTAKAVAPKVASPPVVGVQQTGVLGVPTEGRATWVNLFGKVVSTVIAQKDGVVVPTAARTIAPSATPTAAPSSPQSVSASTGGDGGNGGAATDGGSGGAGGRGGDPVLVPSPAARFVYSVAPAPPPPANDCPSSPVTVQRHVLWSVPRPLRLFLRRNRCSGYPSVG